MKTVLTKSVLIAIVGAISLAFMIVNFPVKLITGIKKGDMLCEPEHGGNCTGCDSKSPGGPSGPNS